MTANTRAHAELPTLLGRKRLWPGGKKGRHGEKSRNSVERVKKTCHEKKLEFPRPAVGRASSGAWTGNSLRPRLSQLLSRPWQELGAKPSPELTLVGCWGDVDPAGSAAGGCLPPVACPRQDQQSPQAENVPL